jgi:hypothetical protein
VNDEAAPLELLEDEGLLVADGTQVNGHEASTAPTLPAGRGIE